MARPSLLGRGRYGVAAAALLVAGVCMTAPVRAQGLAGPAMAITAGFNPERLGSATAVTLAISIDPVVDPAHAAVSRLEVAYPRELGFATSGLGLAECEPRALEALGPIACPANSRVGSGSATVAVPFGSATVHEHVKLGLFAAPSPDGYIHLAIVAQGLEPINARIVMAGEVLPGRLLIDVPPVPSIAGAANVAVISMRVTIGGPLTYYERSHGRTVPYRPRGIALPARCPRGGFRLEATLAFTDDTESRAHTHVPCPRVSSARAASTPR